MIVVFFALAKMGFSHLPFKSIQGGQIASAPLYISITSYTRAFTIPNPVLGEQTLCGKEYREQQKIDSHAIVVLFHFLDFDFPGAITSRRL